MLGLSCSMQDLLVAVCKLLSRSLWNLVREQRSNLGPLHWEPREVPNCGLIVSNDAQSLEAKTALVGGWGVWRVGEVCSHCLILWILKIKFLLVKKKKTKTGGLAILTTEHFNSLIALWAQWLTEIDTQGFHWNERGKWPPELLEHSLWDNCSCCLCEAAPKGRRSGSLLACCCWWMGSSGEALASLAGPLRPRLFLLSVPRLQPLRSPVGLPKVPSWVVCSHL